MFCGRAPIHIFGSCYPVQHNDLYRFVSKLTKIMQGAISKRGGEVSGAAEGTTACGSVYARPDLTAVPCTEQSAAAIGEHH
jgi:hypothetical protein